MVIFNSYFDITRGYPILNLLSTHRGFLWSNVHGHSTRSGHQWSQELYFRTRQAAESQKADWGFQHQTWGVQQPLSVGFTALSWKQTSERASISLMWAWLSSKVSKLTTHIFVAPKWWYICTLIIVELDGSFMQHLCNPDVSLQRWSWVSWSKSRPHFSIVFSIIYPKKSPSCSGSFQELALVRPSPSPATPRRTKWPLAWPWRPRPRQRKRCRTRCRRWRRSTEAAWRKVGCGQVHQVDVKSWGFDTGHRSHGMDVGWSWMILDDIGWYWHMVGSGSAFPYW